MNNPFQKRFARHALFSVLLFAAAFAQAEDVVQVNDPWTKATVPGQKVAGVYMTLVSSKSARVTGASSPVASSAEIHEMRMEGGTMKMRQLPYLELAAGKPVTLAPGGLHVMLFGLKAALKAGEMVPLTLVVTETGGDRRTHKVILSAQVRPVATDPAEHGK